MSIEKLLKKHDYKRLCAIGSDYEINDSKKIDKLGKIIDMSQLNSVIARSIAEDTIYSDIIVTTDILGKGKAAYYRHKKSDFEKNMNVDGWRWFGNTYIENNIVVLDTGQAFLNTKETRNIHEIDIKLQAKYKTQLRKDVLVVNAFNIYGKPLSDSFRAIYVKEED